jgi:hypothetical protein
MEDNIRTNFNLQKYLLPRFSKFYLIKIIVYITILVSVLLYLCYKQPEKVSSVEIKGVRIEE